MIFCFMQLHFAVTKRKYLCSAVTFLIGFCSLWFTIVGQWAAECDFCSFDTTLSALLYFQMYLIEIKGESNVLNWYVFVIWKSILATSHWSSFFINKNWLAKHCGTLNTLNLIEPIWYSMQNAIQTFFLPSSFDNENI